MGTTATDAGSSAHEGQAREELTINDTIEYTGLIPGHEYTAKDTLMDKETSEPALDDDGNEITSETTFTAEESCGSVEVVLTFKGANIAGKYLSRSSQWNTKVLSTWSMPTSKMRTRL